MFFSVDESEALRAEQRLRDSKLAMAEAKRALTEQCRRTLTRPSTLAILLVAGGLIGARRKAPAEAAERRRGASLLGAIVRSIWAPIFKGVTAIAVERALHPRRGEAAASPRDESPGMVS